MLYRSGGGPRHRERMNAGSRIVIGVDGSESSQGALRWALAEALLRGVPLEVLHSPDPDTVGNCRCTVAGSSASSWRAVASALTPNRRTETMHFPTSHVHRISAGGLRTAPGAALGEVDVEDL